MFFEDILPHLILGSCINGTVVSPTSVIHTGALLTQLMQEIENTSSCMVFMATVW
jgi:hypothetical protein